eukprot:130736_1
MSFFLKDLPSNSTNFQSFQGEKRNGVPIYIFDHNTLPPDNRVVRNDETNILIRSLRQQARAQKPKIPKRGPNTRPKSRKSRAPSPKRQKIATPFIPNPFFTRNNSTSSVETGNAVEPQPSSRVPDTRSSSETFRSTSSAFLPVTSRIPTANIGPLLQRPSNEVATPSTFSGYSPSASSGYFTSAFFGYFPSASSGYFPSASSGEHSTSHPPQHTRSSRPSAPLRTGEPPKKKMRSNPRGGAGGACHSVHPQSTTSSPRLPRAAVGPGSCNSAI